MATDGVPVEQIIARERLANVTPKEAGDRLEHALVAVIDGLEHVPDAAAEWHDARATRRFVPPLDLYDTLTVREGSPVEVKTCQVHVSNGADSTTKGRWYLKHQSHQTLVDHGGVYLLAVYDPDVGDDRDPVRAAVLADARAVGREVETWTDATVGGADATVAKVRWDRLLAPERVLEAVPDGGHPEPAHERSALGCTAAELDREQFAKLASDLDEDPARYLDKPLVTAGDRPNPGRLMQARIRGIWDRATLAAFRAVERNLGRGQNGGPREPVMEWLADADDRIRTNGEGPAQTGRDLPPIEDRVDGDHPSVATRLQQRLERRSLETDLGDRNALETARGEETTEQAGLATFADDTRGDEAATDGGG